MMRPHSAILLCLVLAVPAGAQPATETIKLTIHPAATPVPALRYRLVTEVREQTPGNAALLYQRAHNPEWLSASRRQPDYQEKIDKWLQMPLKELPRDEVRLYLPRAALQELELAARRDYCDWELTARARKDGIGLLLPEVSMLREFANLLSLKARLELADGDYDKAIRTLQTGFTMARHMGDATLINALVGLAVTQVFAARVQEIIQMPDGPNLYWALTGLPRPAIDMRKPFQGERLFIDSIFPGIREALADPKAPPLTTEQLRAQLGVLSSSLEMEGSVRSKDLPFQLGAALLTAKTYPQAKKFLLAQGWTAEQVEAMPMLQAVTMLEVYNYDRLYDEMLKWQGLPYWEARAGLQRVENQLKEEKAKGAGVGSTLATLLLPAAAKVHDAHARTDRRIALLRCVEAIRLHAAGQGKLPATLADIRDVPVPVDPYTGKPFEYTCEGDKATLYGPPPAGEPPTGNNSMRCELTLQSK